MVSDTTPQAERVWIELWRKTSPTERLRHTRRLTSRVIRMSRQALRRSKPEMTERQINLWWAELHYGPELAARLSAYLEQHEPSER